MLHQAYEHGTQQALLEAHEFAFVKKVLHGRQRIETERIISLLSVRIGVTKASIAIRQKAMRRVAWKENWDGSGVTV